MAPSWVLGAHRETGKRRDLARVSTLVNIVVLTLLSSPLQANKPATLQDPSHHSRPLLGETDTKRVNELVRELDLRHRESRFDEAASIAREILEVRRRTQPDDWWEVVSARLEAEKMELLSSLPKDQLDELLRAWGLNEAIGAAFRSGNYREAADLLVRQLAVHVRILGDVLGWVRSRGRSGF